METIVALLLYAGGACCTVRTRGIQFRRLGAALRGAFRPGGGASGVSPFAAMSTSLAATLGTGNIAGVAGAVLLGGPGAIFWMWMSALTGMASKYCDIYFGMRFRTKDVIGPMAYMERGLPKRFTPLATVYALLCAAACLLMGNLVQINAIAEAGGLLLEIVQADAGIVRWLPLLTGVVAAALVFAVQQGGAHGIGRAASLLVPMMSALYLAVALFVIARNFASLPAAVASIFRGAASPRAFFVGIARGTFTHEAGLGTAAIAHARVETENANAQGLYGVFEVFFDTIVMCTITALAVLVGGAELVAGGAGKNSALVIEAFSGVLGAHASAWCVTVALALFAFSSILSFSYYGTVCAGYAFGRRGEAVYKAAFLLLLAVGGTVRVALAWRLAEWANMAMGLVNMAALLLLTRPRGARSHTGSSRSRRACGYARYTRSPRIDC